MFFPEGTRSRDGRMKRFSLGAFDLAIKKNIPILPLVIDGTQDCLPKKTWVFTTDAFVNLKVLNPIPTDKLEKKDSAELMNRVRQEMLDQLSEWRNQPASLIDGTVTVKG